MLPNHTVLILLLVDLISISLWPRRAMCQFPPVPPPRHWYTSLRTHQETWGRCRDYKRDAVKVTSNVERVFIEDFTLSGDLSGETVMNSSLLIRLKDRETRGLYYCAARWARQHTPTTILPMSPPSVLYGWKTWWHHLLSSNNLHKIAPPTWGFRYGCGMEIGATAIKTMQVERLSHVGNVLN